MDWGTHSGLGRGLAVLVVALIGCVFGLADARAQSDDEVKSLDQMMDEVDGEIQEGDTGTEEDGSSGASDSKSGNSGEVESLDQIMEEVDENSGVDVPETEKPEEESTESKAPAAAEPSADAPDASASGDEQGGSGWFAFGLVALIVFLIAAGVPLYVLIGTVAGYLLIFGGIFEQLNDLTIIIEETRGLGDEPVLLAIPFFVVSGSLMTEGDIAQRLIDFAEAIFGELPGGLAISTVFACAIFAAISGSSPVTVIAIGTIMYPVLVESGYPDEFSTGVVTSSGSLGILIPPSIPMIVYGIVDPTGLRDPEGYAVGGAGGGDLGVGDLFIAGVVPGSLIGAVLSGYALYTGYRADIETTAFEWSRLWNAFRRGIWSLFLPILILGGIYTGVFTATQAAAVSVIYAVVVEFFVHRSLSIEDVPPVLRESAVLMGSILIIMALAFGFNLYLNRAKIPNAAVELIASWDLSIISFLLMLNVMLLIVGFFMDILSAILILVPLLAPIGFKLGIHPMHLAIIFIVNLEIGYLTPPIGINLFVAGALFDKSLGEVIRSVLPFMGLMLGCLIIVTYIPAVSLGLVSVSNGGSFLVGFPEAAGVEKHAPTEGPDERKKATRERSGADQSGSNEKDEDVKSLDEMMEEVDDEEADRKAGESNGADAGDSEGGDEVKSMDQMMEEVEEETP